MGKINIVLPAESGTIMPMKIERRKSLEVNVGVLGVGHDRYWAQFEGLLERMHEKKIRI